jgi:hypothetical protein
LLNPTDRNEACLPRAFVSAEYCLRFLLFMVSVLVSSFA